LLIETPVIDNLLSIMDSSKTTQQQKDTNQPVSNEPANSVSSAVDIQY
jgi:hypothetical protein